MMICCLARYYIKRESQKMLKRTLSSFVCILSKCHDDMSNDDDINIILSYDNLQIFSRKKSIKVW